MPQQLPPDYPGQRLALRVRQETLKWFLFLMTVCASAAALWH